MVGEVKAAMRAMGAVTGTSPLGVPELVVASEVVVAVARVLRNVNPGGVPCAPSLRLVSSSWGYIGGSN